MDQLRSDRFSFRLPARRLLPILLGALCVLGTAPLQAQSFGQAPFQASYRGTFLPSDTWDGGIALNTVIPGSGTFLPQSSGFFNLLSDPSVPTAVSGAFMLYGGENGTVFGTYQGTRTPPDDSGVVLISGTYMVDDGWLQGFGSAFGTGTFSGEIRLDEGMFSITLGGGISSPLLPEDPLPEPPVRDQ